jgi:hypothetical protein
VNGFPLPGMGESVVAIPAPGNGPLHWAGAPSAALHEDGSIVLAYRVRVEPEDRAETVIARSEDGERFETVGVLDKSRWDAMSIERPALLRTDDGRWRIYVCPARKNSKAWWIELLEADTPEGLADADSTTVFPADDTVAVKDPIVRQADGRWEAWICCHPLDEEGEEDRMYTAYATSDDGIAWEWQGAMLEPRAGRWDGRGARLTAVLSDGRAAYDGRATKDENWFERTGLVEARDTPVSVARYLEVLPLPDGGYRIYYEWPTPGQSHELRTELIRG